MKPILPSRKDLMGFAKGSTHRTRLLICIDTRSLARCLVVGNWRRLLSQLNHSDWLGSECIRLIFPSIRRESFASHGVDVFPSSGLAYHVRKIEVPRRLIEADASIGEPELENTTSQIVFDDDGLLRILEEIGVPIEALELPYKSDYPI